MALTFEFEEEYKTSRNISITENSFQQDFVFFICGNFLDEAIDDPTYGPDDDIVALAAAYAIVPPFRTMPIYAGGSIMLTLSNLSMEQVDNNTWRLSVSYTARPIDQNPTNTGPGEGDRDQWTNNFVQLGFNVAAQQELKTQSIRLVSIQKNSDFGNQLVPYTLYEPAPIGHTEEGVQGSQVYVRGFSFNVTAYFTPQQLNFAYVRRLYRMSTTVNATSFFGFPGGSVLFLEASASGDLHSVIPVTFDFQMRPNFKFTNVEEDARLMDPDEDDENQMFDVFHDPYFPPTTSPIWWPLGFTDITPFPGNAYSGWAEVDYRYVGVTDATAKMDLQKPVLRLIHQQYGISDFNKLEL